MQTEDVAHLVPIPQSGGEKSPERDNNENKETIIPKVDPPAPTDPNKKDNPKNEKERPRRRSKDSDKSTRSRKGNTERAGIGSPPKKGGQPPSPCEWNSGRS